MTNIILTKNQLQFYKKLKIKKFRQQEKLFIIEGLHLIEEAQKYKDLLVAIITSNHNKKFDGTKTYYTNYQNIKQLSTTKSPQEFIGICKFKEKSKQFSNSILVLNKINDPGNLGTLIRTAKSFGIENIIVEGVDIYNSKVLRASQGAIFDVDIFNTTNLKKELLFLKDKEYKLIGSLLKNAVNYNNIEINDNKIVLILGNEANGIDNEIIEILDYKVYIPIKFESLNVAIAGGILLAKYFSK